MTVSMAQALRWANWLLLAALAFTLLFTKDITQFLGMEDGLQSLFVLIAPLAALVLGIELMSRYLAK